jgi:hypothetical protein
MIGHFPIIFWTFFITFSNETLNCYSTIFAVLYYISFADSIFFYFFFNNIFKKILIEYIPFINRNTL